MKDFYRILKVDRKASPEVIKKAYRDLARKYHPDLHIGTEQQKCEEKMKDINEAVNILLDEEKRKEYDEILYAEESRIRQCVYRKESPESVIITPTPTRSYNELKVMVVLFVVLTVIAIAILSFGVYYFFIMPQGDNNTSYVKAPEYIDFGITEAEVIAYLGEPLAKTNHLMVYDNFQIIVSRGRVDGWLDAYNVLNVGEQKRINPDDIYIGENILKLINYYGNPDTYSEELAIYDNIVLILSKGNVSEMLILEEVIYST